MAEFSLSAIVLGVLMMIPLRRILIVAQRDRLRYPEGTACAEVLKAAKLSKATSAQGSPTTRAGPV